MARLEAAAHRANTKVLLHPSSSRNVVLSSNHVATAVVEFHDRLDIESSRQSLEARRWAEAASEARSKVLETGANGVGAARRFGVDRVGRARSAPRKLSSRLVVDGPLRRRDHGEGREEGA